MLGGDVRPVLLGMKAIHFNREEFVKKPDRSVILGAA